MEKTLIVYKHNSQLMFWTLSLIIGIYYISTVVIRLLFAVRLSFYFERKKTYSHTLTRTGTNVYNIYLRDVRYIMYRFRGGRGLQQLLS